MNFYKNGSVLTS